MLQGGEHGLAFWGFASKGVWDLTLLGSIESIGKVSGCFRLFPIVLSIRVLLLVPFLPTLSHRGAKYPVLKPPKVGHA